MPAIVVAVVGSAISSAVGAALGGGIFAAIAGGLAGTLVSGLASRFLTPSQKVKSSSSLTSVDQGISTIMRSSTENMRIIYGRRKVSGVLSFVHTTKQGFASQANLNSYAPTLVTDSRDNAFLHMVIAIAGHEIEEIESVFLGDTEITLDANGYATNSPFETDYVDSGGANQGKYRFVRVKKYLGTPNQTADEDIKTIFSGWTNEHRLRGIAYIYVCLRWYDRVFPNGIPNISAIVKGNNQIYDPRDATIGYTDNWALCVRDFLKNGEYGLGCDDDEIDEPTIIASANISDEIIALKAGGSQARYTCNGIVDTGDAPMATLDNMGTSAGGVIAYSQGKFQVFAGAYDSPTISIDESWVNGEVNVQAVTPRKERFNAVRGVYVAPDKLWQATDYPAVVDSIYAAQDGETIYRDIEFPYVTDAERAQRLARLYLEQGRRNVTVTMSCNLKALQARVWDVVSLTLNEYGFENKPFRITAWRFNQDGGITLELKSDDSNAYSWTSANATNPPNVPTTTLPLPTFVATPGTPVISEELYSTTDGSGVKVRVNAVWGESAGPFVYRYRLEYRALGDTEYVFAAETSKPSTRIEDLAPGKYEFRVKAINTILAESDYSSVAIAELVGLTAPPANIIGLTLNELKGSAHLQWDAATDLDVRIGGYVRIRHTAEIVSPTWSNGLDIGPRLSGTATNVVLPLIGGTYMVKAVDSTGNESLSATMINNQIADLLKMNVVSTKTESPSFSGAAVNMIASSGVLSIAKGPLFDDASGLFDSASGLWDDGTADGYHTTGSYTFSPISGGNTAHADLGAIYRARVMISFDGNVYNADALFDDHGGLFDDGAGYFNGDDIAAVNARFYIRTTNDDPSASPAWSEWRQFIVGDYECRAYQFKMEVDSLANNYNIDITTLEAIIDVPDRDESFDDVALASGGSILTYSLPFYVKPKVVANIQGTSAGDTLKVTHILSGGKYTGATLQVLNGGSGVARTVDVAARGA